MLHFTDIDDHCCIACSQNCVIREARSITTKYLPVVQCMESASDPNSVAKEVGHASAASCQTFVLLTSDHILPQCCMKQGFDWEKINNCAEGPEGSKLLHQAGVATERLEPKLNFVPWIVINGVFCYHFHYLAAIYLK